LSPSVFVDSLLVVYRFCRMPPHVKFVFFKKKILVKSFCTDIYSQFKSAIDIMHRVCMEAFFERKKAFLEYGIDETESSMAPGGKDVTSVLSELSIPWDRNYLTYLR
jgi:hypothetical protein